MNLLRPTLWARAARALPILGTSIAAFLASPAHAALDTWNAFGAGPFNWNDGLSWLDGTAPLAADPTLDVLFPGGSGATTTNNDIAGLLLNSLTFQGGAVDTVSISGNTLDFRTDGATPTITQNGAGAVTISAGIVATNALGFNGSGAGVTALTGVVSGTGGLTFSSGNWQLSNAANSFSGNITINTGAFVEVVPAGAAPQSVNLTPAATSLLGSNVTNTNTINGGTLKITTKGTGNLVIGGKAFTFGANGGTLDLRNTSGVAGTQGGNINGGDLNLTLNNTAGNPAVVQFNGGQNGLSDNAANNGNWNTGGNVLRIASLAGTGPLRVEITNGAMYAPSVGTVNSPSTIRGVLGGDPTSGVLGNGNPGISTNTGRVGVNANIVNYTQGLRLEDAIQIHGPGSTRAIDGNLVVAGSAGGHPGYVVFNGRSTGTALGAGINNPGTNTANQNPLWIGQGQNDTLTIENGGIAVFDLRVRYEQGNHNGVLLDGRAVIQGGGQLRMGQSMSNFSYNTAGLTSPSTTANVGDHVIRGDIEGQGSTASEAILDLQLPAPQATASAGVPATITGAPAGNSRPHGGLRFEDTTGNADFIVNGTGFGGLRINGSARPNALFSGATPDPVTTLTKINDALPALRLNRVTGTGGYLTIAPADQTYTLPVGGEWADADVGLKVVNHNSTGVDVSLGSASSWGRNLAVDTGASLDLGAANPFSLTAGTLHGTGTVSGTGSLQISSGANISPGLGGVGTLTVGNLSLDGSLLLDVTNTPAVDVLGAGNLTLGPGSTLLINPGSTFNNAPYTLATYSGTLTGTFGAVSGLPLGYSVDYGTAGILRLVFTSVGNKIWNGTPGAVWSTNVADANWQGGQAFNNLDTVTFDDTAAGSKTVTINGLVSVSTVTVNTASTYFLNGNFAGSAMTGSGSLTKSGTGTLELNGAHNYTGGTFVNAGTLRVGSNNSLPDLGSVTIASGATLDLNGKTDTVASLILNGNLTAGNLTVGALTLGGGANVPANLTLSGDVTKTGAASTISGTVDLDAGNRSFNVASTTAPELTISGAVSNGSLTKVGNGTLVLTSAGNAQSTTTVNGGTLRAGVAGAIPAGTTATVGASGVLDLNNIPHTFPSLSNSGITTTGGAALTVTSLSGAAPGAIQMGGGLLTLNPASGTSTYGGAVTGTGTQVIKQGAGMITLTGASTYTGGLDIQAGRVNASGGAGGTGGINVNPGTGLQLIGNLTGNVTVSGGTVSSAADTTNAISGNFNIAGNSLIHLYNEDNTTQTGDFAMTGTLRGTGNLDVSIVAVGSPGTELEFAL